MSGSNDSLKAVPINLKGLLNYQQGSVVSRTLVDKQPGTVTLFAFDAGEGLSEHTAPFDATILIIEGVADITIDGKVSPVNEGEMIIMPANIPHSVRGGENPFKMLLIMIRA